MGMRYSNKIRSTVVLLLSRVSLLSRVTFSTGVDSSPILDLALTTGSSAAGTSTSTSNDVWRSQHNAQLLLLSVCHGERCSLHHRIRIFRLLLLPVVKS